MERRAWGLLQGERSGWTVRAFMFKHDPDPVVLGARTITRVFARNLLAATSLATDSRTAEQRGVIVAVDYEGEPATFKIRGRKVIARNKRARQVLTESGSSRTRHWVPPARIELRGDWFFLHSFYILPKWLGPYVEASTDICTALAESGVIRPRHGSA